MSNFEEEMKRAMEISKELYREELDKRGKELRKRQEELRKQEEELLKQQQLRKQQQLFKRQELLKQEEDEDIAAVNKFIEDEKRREEEDWELAIIASTNNTNHTNHAEMVSIDIDGNSLMKGYWKTYEEYTDHFIGECCNNGKAYQEATADNFNEDIDKIIIISIIMKLIAQLTYKNSKRLQIPGDGFCSYWAMILLVLMLGEKLICFDINQFIDCVNTIDAIMKNDKTLTHAIALITGLAEDTQMLEMDDTILKLCSMYKNHGEHVTSGLHKYIPTKSDNSYNFTYVFNFGGHFDMIYNNDVPFKNFDMRRLEAIKRLLEIFNDYRIKNQTHSKEDEQIFRQFAWRV
jgi:hypothetical protein